MKRQQGEEESTIQREALESGGPQLMRMGPGECAPLKFIAESSWVDPVNHFPRKPLEKLHNHNRNRLINLKARELMIQPNSSEQKVDSGLL